MEAKKIKIGDIAEIKTPAGLAYVQYTHDSKDMGQIVRVLPGLYAFRPADFTELARQKELYFIFYTLRYALRAGQTEIVSRQRVPDWAKPVPLMRHGGVAPAEGRRPIWRIVDALAPLTLEFLQRTPVTSDLTHEQRKLSIHVLWPHQVMVEELARGWTPERAEEFEEQDRARARARRAGQPATTSSPPEQAMRHYLYFPEKSSAEKAAQWFRSQKFTVEVRKGADGKTWLALVKHAPLPNIEDRDKLRDEMEALAAKLNGEYDGWELAG